MESFALWLECDVLSLFLNQTFHSGFKSVRCCWRADNILFFCWPQVRKSFCIAWYIYTFTHKLILSLRILPIYIVLFLLFLAKFGSCKLLTVVVHFEKRVLAHIHIDQPRNWTYLILENVFWDKLRIGHIKCTSFIKKKLRTIVVDDD